MLNNDAHIMSLSVVTCITIMPAIVHDLSAINALYNCTSIYTTVWGTENPKMEDPGLEWKPPECTRCDTTITDAATRMEIGKHDITTFTIVRSSNVSIF